jgi:hypothetical protein
MGENTRGGIVSQMIKGLVLTDVVSSEKVFLLTRLEVFMLELLLMVYTTLLGTLLNGYMIGMIKIIIKTANMLILEAQKTALIIQYEEGPGIVYQVT